MNSFPFWESPRQYLVRIYKNDNNMAALHEIKLQGFKVEFSNCFVLFIQKSENASSLFMAWNTGRQFKKTDIGRSENHDNLRDMQDKVFTFNTRLNQ